MPLTLITSEIGLDGPKIPMQFAAPIYFGVPAVPTSKINNGTLTLLRYRGRPFGITNHHVIYEYRRRKRSEKGIQLMVGNFSVADINDVLAFEDKDLDLYVIDLSDAPDHALESGDEVPTRFYETDQLTVGAISPDDVVCYGGYPGILRDQANTTELIFGTASSGGSLVTRVTDRNIVFQGMKEGQVIFNYDNKSPIDFGGISGGPVLVRRTVSADTIEFSLAGVIYQNAGTAGEFYARPLSLIEEPLNFYLQDA